MAKAFKLTSEDAQLLLEAYQLKKAQLDEHLEKLRSKISELREIIKEHEIFEDFGDTGATETAVFPDEYNPFWTWGKKIEYVFEANKRGSTKNIVDILSRIDEKVRNNRPLAIKSISATLSEGFKAGRYEKIQNEQNENIYSIKKEPSE